MRWVRCRHPRTALRGGAHGTGQSTDGLVPIDSAQNSTEQPSANVSPAGAFRPPSEGLRPMHDDPVPPTPRDTGSERGRTTPASEPRLPQSSNSQSPSQPGGKPRPSSATSSCKTPSLNSAKKKMASPYKYRVGSPTGAGQGRRDRRLRLNIEGVNESGHTFAAFPRQLRDRLRRRRRHRQGLGHGLPPAGTRPRRSRRHSMVRRRVA
jgi:hypothetical protein